MKVKGFKKIIKVLFVFFLVVTLLPALTKQNAVHAVELADYWTDVNNFVDFRIETNYDADPLSYFSYLVDSDGNSINDSNGNPIPYLRGVGSETDPFLIESAEQLAGLSYNALTQWQQFTGVHFKLISDIDLGAHLWTPINGTPSRPFQGIFDGLGCRNDDNSVRSCKIKNLTIESSNENAGLFGLNEGTLKNVILENVTVTAPGRAGALVGYNSNADSSDISTSCLISNITVQGLVKITGTLWDVGGVVGLSERGCTLSHISVIGSAGSLIAGRDGVGGLIGGFTDDSVTSNLLEYSDSNIDVTGLGSVGGLVGYYSYGVIQYSSATGNVSGTGESMGGLVGESTDSQLKYVYANGAVNGNERSGGLVGYFADVEISDAYATGNVTGTNYIGGLVGYAEYGGLISNAYSFGSVSGTKNSGGLIGYFADTLVTVNNSFWDTETSSQTNSVAGVGETTENMKLQKTFTDMGWDFSGVWSIEEADVDSAISYPFLIDNKQVPAPGHQPIVASDFAGGKGTESDPYQIKTAKQLDNIRLLDSNGKPLYLDKHFILLNDVDLSTIPNWNPIIFLDVDAFQYVGFTGKFDGDGKKITGLTIDTKMSYAGLFGLNKGEIKNLGIVGAKITSTSYNVGIIAGYNVGKIINSYVTGLVSGGTDAGGLAGRNHGLIQTSYADVSVSAIGDAGGLVGSNYVGGDILNSYALGSVFCTNSRGGAIGGLAGNNVAKITNSYSVGPVIGDCSVKGGLVGSNEDNGIVSNSYWDILTSLQATSAAGTGFNTAKMKQKETFIGWDFNTVWAIKFVTKDSAISYPYLLSNVQDPAPGYESFKEVKKIIIDVDNYGAEFEGLENIGLTKEESAQTLSVKLVLTPKSINDLSAAEKALIDQYVSKNISGTPNTLLLDVSLFKVVNGEESTITSTTDKITISFVVPSSYRGKTFDLVRSHEGVIEKLDYTYDAKTYTVTFKTDKFSTYGVVMGSGSSSTLPNTGVDGSAAALLLLLGLVLLGLTKPVLKKRTKK